MVNNDIKPMVYQADRTQEILASGKYKDYQFYVLSLGTHPTAYVEIPKNNKLYGMDYDDIYDSGYDINCHFGLTYSKNFLYGVKENSWFIGWDYAHYTDYAGYEMRMPKHLKSNGKKWTTEEILQEVCEVIDQVIEINNKESD